MNRRLGCVILVCATVVIQSSLLALPRFAAATGTRCMSCHENPSGGGMRKAFGVQYGREALPVPSWSKELDLDEFSTKLTDFVSVGADFRTLFFYQQGAVIDQNAFWQMQGNVYMNFKVAKKFSMYLSKGLYDGFEIYGLLTVLPENGHIKLGKFVPNYGLKLDDHRASVRQHTGFSPEFGRPELTGGELAVAPGPAMMSAGIYNSTEGTGGPTGNNEKAFLGRAEGVFKASEEVNIWIGGNVFTKKSSQGMRTTLFGGFGSVSYKDLTIMGEVDIIRNTGAGTTKDSTGFATYLEANYVVTSGVDIKLAWDFHDRDKDLKTGSVSKYSLGVEFFPLPGVEVRPIYRIVVDEPVNMKNNEFQFLIHFYL